MKISGIQNLYNMAGCLKSNLESLGCSSVATEVVPDDYTIHVYFIPVMPVKFIKVNVVVNRDI
jgi:hypothetical protein